MDALGFPIPRQTRKTVRNGTLESANVRADGGRLACIEKAGKITEDETENCSDVVVGR